MNIGWQDVGVAVIVVLAVMFLYRHFRPRRGVVAVIPTSSLRVRQKRPPAPGP
jgi:hypothetical protein